MPKEFYLKIVYLLVILWQIKEPDNFINDGCCISVGKMEEGKEKRRGNEKEIKDKKSNVKWYVAGIAVLAALILVFVFGNFGKNEQSISSGERVIVTPENLPAVLESQPFVKDLPKSASINIKFGDLEYSISGGEVKAGSVSDADISISLHEKYLDKLNDGICSAISEAAENGDISYDIAIGNTKLLWKYKSVLKYKDCLNS